MAKAPFALRLGFTLVDDGFFLGRNIADQLSLSARRAHSLIAAYAMSEPEKAFARRVLRNKRNLWLFRCHQRRFCGDFAIVDMSAGVAAERRASNSCSARSRPPRRRGRSPTIVWCTRTCATRSGSGS